MEELIVVETKDRTAIITLNRPKAFNAFNLDMFKSFAERLIEVSNDPGVLGVVITGEGKAFCAGGDLRWVAEYGKTYGEAFHALAASFHQAIMEIRHMPKPVIAAINGLAAGGGFSLSLACDFRIMATSALFRQAYTSNGLSIDGGGTFTLPRLVGMTRALEVAAFDRPIPADKALAWGLVNEVVENGQALVRALEMMTELQKSPLSSFAASKKLLNGSLDTSLETQLEKERDMLSSCAEHPNGKEGITAFLEKRKPVYSN